MRKYSQWCIRAVCVVALATVLSGCASAPMDVTRAFANDERQDPHNITQAADDLTQTAQARLWVSEPRTNQTRQILSRLIGGREDGAEPDTTPYNPVDTYLADLSQREGPRTLSYGRDIEKAIELAIRLSETVERTAERPGTGDAHVLGELVENSEKALVILTRSKDLLRSSFVRLSEEEAPHAFEGVSDKLTELGQAHTRLSSAIDALAAKRWSMIHGIVG